MMKTSTIITQFYFFRKQEYNVLRSSFSMIRGNKIEANIMKNGVAMDFGQEVIRYDTLCDRKWD